MGRIHFFLALGLLALVFISGCVGGDAKGIARELQTTRVTYVPEGLLAPTNSTDRDAYQNALLGFRKRIQDAGGLQRGTLNDYVDGSLALIAMNEEVEKGNADLENASATFLDCSTNGYGGKALASFQLAREKSDEANKSFGRVLTDATISNELGVVFLQNAQTTTEGTTAAYAQRGEDIKTSCGNSS